MKDTISTLLLFFVLFFAVTAEGAIEQLSSSSGIVEYYNEAKGFGYIIDDTTGDELFVHEDGLIDEIIEGDKVKYNLRDTRKGFESIDVRLK